MYIERRLTPISVVAIASQSGAVEWERELEMVVEEGEGKEESKELGTSDDH